MKRQCQHCGRPATYRSRFASHGRRRGRFVARNDHDLCARCFRKAMDAVRAAEIVVDKNTVTVENRISGIRRTTLGVHHMPDRWAILLVLEDIDEFCATNPTEVGSLAKNTALVEYLLQRMIDLYSKGDAQVQ